MSDRSPKTIVCTACGEQLPGDAKFCGVCGFKLTPIELPAPSAVGRISLARVPANRAAATAKQAVGRDHAYAETMLSIELPPSLGVPEHRQSADPQRVYRRFPMKVEVGYYSAHNFFKARTENISAGGLFIATPDPVAVGDLLEVEVTLPGLAVSCTVRCEVKWIRRWGEAGTPAPGMGCSFVELDEQARLAIEAFLAHREPIVV